MPAARREEVAALLDITRRWAGERTYAVASRGLVALHDPERLMARLVEAVGG